MVLRVDVEASASELAQEVSLLLELRESAAVPRLAAARLAALVGAGEHRVLRVFPVAVARVADAPSDYAVAADSVHGDAAPVALGGDADLLEAIRGRRPVQRDGRLLVPFSAGDEVRHVLELVGTAALAPGAALAAALLPLAAAYYELLADAETDPLTRLANRRLFYSQVGASLAQGTAARPRFLAIADLDHFKLVNDRFGHLYGDEILIHFARLLRTTFRAGDSLYRFGGEEFVIVFCVDRREARLRALERFRHAVESYAFPRVGRVTASIGFTALDSALTPVTTYVDRADRALYVAKARGRNQVQEYEALIADGSLSDTAAESGGEATLF